MEEVQAKLSAQRDDKGCDLFNLYDLGGKSTESVFAVSCFTLGT